MTDLKDAADTIAMFCRLNLHRKRDLPIRSSEMGLLIFVSRSEVPPTPNEAARFFGVSRPMVTAMVQSLVGKKYLERHPSPTDARSFTLVLTAAGGNLVATTRDDYNNHTAYLERQMGATAFAELMTLLSQANQIMQGSDYFG